MLGIYPSFARRKVKIPIRQKKKKMARFRKPYRPYFFGAYSKFFWDIWELYFYFRVFLIIFMHFLYKKFVPKKVFAYLPTLKNIGTFPETRHLFFFGLIPQPLMGCDFKWLVQFKQVDRLWGQARLCSYTCILGQVCLELRKCVRFRTPHKLLGKILILILSINF